MKLIKNLIKRVKEYFKQEEDSIIVIRKHFDLPEVNNIPDMPPVQSKRKNKKLTESQKQRIRTLVKRGKSVGFIAADVGISKEHVRYYFNKFSEE